MVYHGDTLETVPAKLTPKLIQEIDELVKIGWYANRSEAIRDAVRELIERKRLVKMRKVVEEDIEWGLYGK
jgi:putative addiction module CopG family antidote